MLGWENTNEKLISLFLVGFLVFNSGFGTVAASVNDEVIENNMEAVTTENELTDAEKLTEELMTEEVLTEETTEFVVTEENTETAEEPETTDETACEIISCENTDWEEELLQASIQIKVNAVDTDNGKYRIILGKNDVPAGYTSLKAAIWSDKNGQDDLIWYDMKLTQEGNYTSYLSLLKHFGENGIFNVHIYGCVNNEAKKIIGKTTFNALPMKKNIITVKESGNKNNMLFKSVILF